MIAWNDIQNGKLMLNGSPDRLDDVLGGTIADNVDDLPIRLELSLGESNTRRSRESVTKNAAKERKKR